jgi:hypothetical protein
MKSSVIQVVCGIVNASIIRSLRDVSLGGVYEHDMAKH